MIPQLDATRVDGGVLLFALLATTFCAMLVGLVPALRQSSTSMHDAIRAGRGGAAQPRRRIRSLLVVAEVAMALVILVGAGLLTRSFLALQKVDQGFNPGPTLTFAVTLPRARYDSAAKMVSFHDQLQQRLGSIPGVEAVSAIDPLPLGGSAWSGSFHIEGRPSARGQEPPHGEYNVALPGFIGTLGMHLVKGRDFEATDGRDAPLVAIVDERLVEKYWPGEDPIGKRISDAGDEGPWASVVGVVRHVYRSGPRSEGEPQMYFAYRQRVQTPLSYVIRTSVDPVSIIRSVRARSGQPGCRPPACPRRVDDNARVSGVGARSLQRPDARVVCRHGPAARRDRPVWRDGVPREPATGGNRDQARAWRWHARRRATGDRRWNADGARRNRVRHGCVARPRARAQRTALWHRADRPGHVCRHRCDAGRRCAAGIGVTCAPRYESGSGERASGFVEEPSTPMDAKDAGDPCDPGVLSVQGFWRGSGCDLKPAVRDRSSNITASPEYAAAHCHGIRESIVHGR